MKKIYSIMGMIISIVLMALPQGVPMTFAPNPEETVTRYYSYFSPMPFGYGNWFPIVIAILSICIIILLFISLRKNCIKAIKVCVSINIFATLLSWIIFNTFSLISLAILILHIVVFVDQSKVASQDKGIKAYQKWITIVVCFVFIIAAMLLALHFMNSTDRKLAPLEIVVELNHKIYSVVHTKGSPVYKEYHLEKHITSDLLGEYLGECTVQIDNEGNHDTFKLYRYLKAPQTQYDWYPRLVVESSNGSYAHALIGSVFNDKDQTATEVLTVYGLLSPDDIVSIENEKGKKITDRKFIESFYKGLFTKEYGDNDFLQENVYQNTGIDESQINELYHKYADDTIYLKVELANGLVIGVDFTSHHFVEVDHDLYFRVEDSWLDLVSVFK